MIKINLSTFMDLYENGEVEDVVVIGTRSTRGSTGGPARYRVHSVRNSE
jgi:hypothetical protein